MGMISGFIKFATGVVSIIGSETLKSAFVGNFTDEIIFEPILGFVRKKQQEKREGRNAFALLNDVLSKEDIDAAAIREKLNILDECLKKDSPFKRFVSKIFKKDQKKDGRETAKQLLNEYKDHLVKIDVKQFIEKIAKDNPNWNSNGKYEKIAINLFEVYVESLPKLLYSELPGEFQYSVKIMQSELSGVKDDIQDDITEIKNMLQIVLQQHAPLFADIKPSEVKSPFAFIRRQCPNCGYNGEYLYYNKPSQTVYCSACGTFYDVEKDCEKNDEIKELIESTKDAILKEISDGNKKHNEELEAIAVVHAEIAAMRDSVDTASDAVNNRLEDFAEQFARNLVLQSDKIDKLLSGQKVTFNALKSDFALLKKELGNIGDYMKTDVHKAIADINAQIEIQTSEIVRELRKKHEETLAEVKDGNNNALIRIDRLQNLIETKEDSNYIDRETIRDILDILNELRNGIKVQFEHKRKSNPTQKKERYLCPYCFEILHGKNDKKTHACTCKDKDHTQSFIPIVDGKCNGVGKTIEKRINALSDSNALGEHIIKLKLDDPTEAFDKFGGQHIDNNVDLGASVVIYQIATMPIDDSHRPLSDNEKGIIDGFTRIIVITTDSIAPKLKREHFVTSNSSASICVIADSLVIEEI